jgi:signal transduction histidine kinase
MSLEGVSWKPHEGDPPRRPASGVRIRSGLFVAIALAGLLALIATSILAARHKAQAVYTELDEVNLLHRYVEAKLRRLRSDIHLSGIFVRDYLLDPSPETGPVYRERLTELRQATTGTIVELERSVGPRQAERIAGLHAKLEDYWKAFDPLIGWTPAEKAANSYYFLRREVLPRREAVLEIAQAIEEFNNENIRQQREEIAGRERDLHAYLNRMLLISLIAGACVAIATVFRIYVLEKRSEREQRRAERAEEEMRGLTQQLVRTQEEERRNLSRELHDEVGQILTGLRMEVGNAEKAHLAGSPAFEAHIAESKHLVDTLIQTVRHLSMGLRPSMLDDLGLQPALEWQANDFTRRYNVPVNLKLDGALDAVGEPHRTTVYRVVQEALTNCARHAEASQISVSIRGAPRGIRVLVHDDGVGFREPADQALGLGLIGIKERVRELGGEMLVHSTSGAGSTLEIEVPLPQSTEEVHLAHRTGG